MRLQFKKLLYLLPVLLMLASCGNFEKIRKSSDVNYKLTKANEYYDKGDYAHANQLYKELMPIMKSTRNYESLFYKYAYTFYYQHDYLEGSYYFKNFTEYFPASKNAEECEYMSALCLFKYAPKYTLDQTNTVKALEAMQSYVNKYPNSKYINDANGYLDESHKKLELKGAGAARLYFNIERYKAAMVSYKSVMRNYPDSPNSDLYQYMIVKSAFRFARKSIQSKQEERYASAISAFHDLKDNYPNSKYLADAQKMSEDADNIIKRIRDEQHQ